MRPVRLSSSTLAPVAGDINKQGVKVKEAIQNLIITAAVGLSLFGQAQAQPEKPSAGLTVVYGKWANEAQCNAGLAKSIRLEDLLANAKAHHNECVSVEGYYATRALFVNFEDTQVRHAISNRSVMDERIGIYASEAVGENLHALNKGTYLKIIGLVWNCEDLNATDVIMVLGYCHNASGPILGITGFDTAVEP